MAISLMHFADVLFDVQDSLRDGDYKLLQDAAQALYRARLSAPPPPSSAAANLDVMRDELSVMINHVQDENDELREQLMVTDIRVGSAARLSHRLAQGSLAARLHLEEEVKKANAELEDFPAAEPIRRAEALAVLLKMLQQQDEQIGHCIKLLAEPKSLDGATLRTLAQASS